MKRNDRMRREWGDQGWNEGMKWVMKHGRDERIGRNGVGNLGTRERRTVGGFGNFAEEEKRRRDTLCYKSRAALLPPRSPQLTFGGEGNQTLQTFSRGIPAPHILTP